MAFDFEKALRRKIDQHTKLVERRNRRVKDGNGVFDRWENPVLTAATGIPESPSASTATGTSW